MTTILLIISFLLHLILLVTIYQLYQQIQELKSARSRDTEVLLSRFLDEIKQENRQLQQQLQQAEQKQEQAPIPKKEVKKHTSVAKARAQDETELPPLPIETEDKVETSMESRVFQMHQNGYTVEEIAKQMDRGKTEVELLIKLHHSGSV